MGVYNNQFTKMIIMTTHNLCFYGEIRKLFPYLQLQSGLGLPIAIITKCNKLKKKKKKKKKNAPKTFYLAKTCGEKYFQAKNSGNKIFPCSYPYPYLRQLYIASAFNP